MYVIAFTYLIIKLFIRSIFMECNTELSILKFHSIYASNDRTLLGIK